MQNLFAELFERDLQKLKTINSRTALLSFKEKKVICRFGFTSLFCLEPKSIPLSPSPESNLSTWPTAEDSFHNPVYHLLHLKETEMSKDDEDQTSETESESSMDDNADMETSDFLTPANVDSLQTI